MGEERQQLLSYQEKLDEARERLDNGEITQEELKDIKAELAATMPDAVREKLGLDKPDNDAEAKAQNDALTLPDDMDSLMRQTGLGPTGPMPG